MTPCPPGDGTDQPVNEVARQAGANPITLPSDTNHVVSTIAGGEISPTGVNYLSIYPPWTDAKEAPSWYAKGGDVDGILDVADTLDWLADTGDLNETYEAAPDEDSNSLPDMGDDGNDDDDDGQDDDDASDADDGFFVKPSTSVSTLPHVDSNVESMVPTLPSLFDNEASFSGLLNAGPSVCDFKSLHSGSGLLDGHLQVFDSAMDEHAFVSTILEEDNPNDSSECLAALG